MKLFLGSDHGGFLLKQRIKEFISKEFSNLEMIDVGCETADSCDYPIFGKKVAEEVLINKGSLGIVICGSGVGISIAANRVRGIRAVLANSIELAKLGRQHNGAQILAMGERTQFIDSPEKIISVFLTTEIDQSERHKKRRNLLDL
jgi:ribose 5-phosphate isomerase B